jgi:uncharacterized protein YukE
MEQTTQESFQKIWRLFEETDRRFKDIARRFKETDRKFKETDRKFKETRLELKEIARRFRDTDQKFKDTDRRFKDTDQKFKDTDQKFKETDRRFKDTDSRFRDTDGRLRNIEKILENTSRQIQDLTGSWGKFVESMVEPAVVRLFQARGIMIEATATRVKKRKDGKEIEIDILGYNRDYVVAVEVKTTLKVEDVKFFLETLGSFKHFFPEHDNKKLVGAVAGMKIEEGVDRFAYRQGLFIMAQKGESIVLLNDETFLPHIW